MSSPTKTYDDEYFGKKLGKPSMFEDMDNTTESLKESIRELKKMQPQDLPENLDKTFLVEEDLYNLGVIVARCSLRGVSKDIIADTLINNLNYQSIAQIQGKFESYLREVKY